MKYKQIIIVAVIMLLLFILNVIYPIILNNNNSNYEFKINHNKLRIIKENNLNILFEIKDKVKVEIPRIYNSGYRLYDENNNEYIINKSSNNQVEAYLNKGIYKLKYIKSLTIRIINLILVIILIYLMYLKVKTIQLL